MIYETVSLADIIRISPFNPRQDMESDVSELAATIRSQGLTDPLVVCRASDDAGRYEVLAGGRRWRALQSLGGHVAGVPVRIFEGDERQARELALALAVTQKPHHPVEEYEAFAALESAGVEIARIAADFGLTERHVRQRLALGKLAPRLRRMWREGEIDADAAKAWATGSVEAQEALLDEALAKSQDWLIKSYYAVRQRLRGEAMEEDAPEAVFLNADPARIAAYEAGGGRVQQELWDDGVRFLDPPIARKVVDELLFEIAQRKAGLEGWARAVAAGEPYEREWRTVKWAPDDEARYDEIEELLQDCDDDAERARLEAEQDALQDKSILAAYPPEDRATLGVKAELDTGGRVVFVHCRAVAAREAVDDEAAPPREDAPDDAAAEDDGSALDPPDAPAPPPDPLAEPAKALRAVIDDAATRGLASILAMRGDIALAFAVAAIGAMYGAKGVQITGRRSAENTGCELLDRIRDMNFWEALDACAKAPTCDLSVAFYRCVAHSIDTQGVELRDIGKLFASAAWRGADVKRVLGEALDRRAFFEAAPKAQTLKIIGGLIGDGEAKRVKGFDKTQLATHAATLSRDKGHLPSPFADWAAAQPGPEAGADAIDLEAQTPLAQAMAEAIEQDEAAPAKKPRRARVKTQKEGA